MLNENVSDVFGPRKVSFSEIGINSLWAFISGIIWSIVIFMLIFLSSSVIDISWNFEKAQAGMSTNSIFPFILSIIAFIASSISIFATYFFLTKTDPSKYKSLSISYSQIAFFIVLTYIFLTPLYIYAGAQNYDNIMYVFLGHILILAFWTHVIAEILNNYKYILIWIYWSFTWLFVTIILSISIFSSFSDGFAKLIAMLLVLPIINTFIMFFKQLFELWYYKYHKYTWLDQLGDIFSQIKAEEDEEFREAEALNN